MTQSPSVESQPIAVARTPFLKRMLRAALLHADTYEEIEADRSSLAQAASIVLLACLASGAGFLLRVQTGVLWLEQDGSLELRLAIITLEPLVIWLGGSAFAFMVGATFFRGPETETDYLEVLRTTGFAFTPALLAVLSFLPPAGLGLGLLALARVWSLCAAVVAVRQALDFNTLRAIGTFGVAVALLWLFLWGLAVAPLPSL